MVQPGMTAEQQRRAGKPPKSVLVKPPVSFGFRDARLPQAKPSLPVMPAQDFSTSPTPAADWRRSGNARYGNRGSAVIPEHETSGIVAAAKALHKVPSGAAAPYETQETMTDAMATEAGSGTQDGGSGRLPNAVSAKK